MLHGAVPSMHGSGVSPVPAARAQARSTPEAFAACVAIASINAGDRQSYGSSFSSLSRERTAPMFSGLSPDSMMDDTNAANSGADQPDSRESSVWTKSKP